MATCYCENPPGGSITCPEGYVPFCSVRGGAAHTYCLPIPEAISGLALTAWFFSHLVGREVTTGEAMTRTDLHAALLDGRFVNRETGEIVRFTIPESIYLPIPAGAHATA